MATKYPAGLSTAARKLWKSITDEFELSAAELRILEDACREMAIVDRIEEQLERARLIVAGSMGQDTANPLLQEIRQHRAVLARLLTSLKLPSEGEVSDGKAASASARELANRRWRGAS